MGTPESWGAMADVGPDAEPHSSDWSLREALATTVSTRMVGYPVRVHLQRAALEGPESDRSAPVAGGARGPHDLVSDNSDSETLDRLVLTNLGTCEQIVLAQYAPSARQARRLTRASQLHVETFGYIGPPLTDNVVFRGQLSAIRCRRSVVPGGPDDLVFHFDANAVGPALTWAPLRRQLLRRTLPESLADTVLGFLPEVWASPICREVVVGSKAQFVRHGCDNVLADMMFWPVMLDDWVLLRSGETLAHDVGAGGEVRDASDPEPAAFKAALAFSAIEIPPSWMPGGDGFVGVSLA